MAIQSTREIEVTQTGRQSTLTQATRAEGLSVAVRLEERARILAICGRTRQGASLRPQLRVGWRVDSYVVVWRVLLGIYVAATLAALVVVNANQSDWPAAVGMLAAVALALGWGTASGWGAVVAWLLIPLALPFGYANQFAGGGDPDLMALLAVMSAAISTVLILFAAGARVLYNRHRPRGFAVMPESTERSQTPRLEAASPPPMVDVRRTEERNSTTETIGTP
jgi:hypothetical protein